LQKPADGEPKESDGAESKAQMEQPRARAKVNNLNWYWGERDDVRVGWRL